MTMYVWENIEGKLVPIAELGKADFQNLLYQSQTLEAAANDRVHVEKCYENGVTYYGK